MRLLNKSSLVASALALSPRRVWRHRVRSWKIGTGEAEEALIPWLCNSRKTSLDVGMAAGAYAARMLLHSAKVIGFEPNPQSATFLRSMFAGTRLVNVEQVALSDSEGCGTMWIPVDRPMLGTLEPPAHLSEFTLHEIAVNCRTLDSYRFHSVGFVKIDVEAHEISLLRGALCTLLREKPKVLIEVGAAHVREVSTIFSELNYTGHFLCEGKLIPLCSFNPGIHQNPDHLIRYRRRGLYINNFIFLPPGEVPCTQRGRPLRVDSADAGTVDVLVP